MKSLSVKQPFADLILIGKKTIETRTWKTKYRGELLICSSKLIHNGHFLLNNELINCKNYKKTPTGCMVCICNLIDCREMIIEDEIKSCCNIYPNAYSWILSDIKPVKQLEIKGKLGLFETNESLIEIL